MNGRSTLPNHDIRIIGASAGGLEASLAIISKLPANFPAALFVVTHMSSEGPSLLPDILAVRSTLGGPRHRGHAD
jgi:two-component system chemotaxis response regulator CheB